MEVLWSFVSGSSLFNITLDIFVMSFFYKICSLLVRQRKQQHDNGTFVLFKFYNALVLLLLCS